MFYPDLGWFILETAAVLGKILRWPRTLLVYISWIIPSLSWGTTSEYMMKYHSHD